jgi:hypothetical protein
MQEEYRFVNRREYISIRPTGILYPIALDDGMRL